MQIRDISPLLVTSSPPSRSLSHASSWAGSMHTSQLPSTQPSMHASQDFIAHKDSQHPPLNPPSSAVHAETDHLISASEELQSEAPLLNMNIPSRFSSAVVHAAPTSYPPVVDMHFCERSRALSLVLADGSAALCSGASETHPLVRYKHFVVGEIGTVHGDTSACCLRRQG
jgi:hypothetical protein